jgi:hypothetical protein
VLEDLAPRATLHSVLSHGLTPKGVAGLHTFASTMARLHAALPGLDPRAHSWDEDAGVLLHRSSVRLLLVRLAEFASLTHQASVELEAALVEIHEPVDLTAFSNGDSGAKTARSTPPAATVD